MKRAWWGLILGMSLLGSAPAMATSRFSPPRPFRHQLASGLTLFILEDHEFPTVRLKLYLRGGELHDPPGKAGTARLAAWLTRHGGTRSRPPEKVERQLEDAAIQLSFGMEREYGTIELKALKEKLPLALEILVELLREPRFDRSRFRLAVSQAGEKLRRDRDDPLVLAEKIFPQLVYGAESPWGATMTEASLRAITVEDCRRYGARFFVPGQMFGAASGDFAAAELLRQLEALTRGWASPAEPLPPLPPVPRQFAPSLALLKKDLAQSTLVLGHLGEKRGNPDKFALLVMNYVLGGSGALTSRLGEAIRVRAGKAYGIWSQFGFAEDYGLFRMVAQTAGPNTVGVLQQMRTILAELAAGRRLSEAEVGFAKQAILRSLIFESETRFEIASAVARFVLWGYPENYLEIFARELGRVSLADVRRVARRYLHPEGLAILVIGDPARFDEGLDKAGKVREIAEP